MLDFSKKYIILISHEKSSRASGPKGDLRFGSR
jgi:hypothetical protein